MRLQKLVCIIGALRYVDQSQRASVMDHIRADLNSIGGLGMTQYINSIGCRGSIKGKIVKEFIIIKFIPYGKQLCTYADSNPESKAQSLIQENTELLWRACRAIYTFDLHWSKLVELRTRTRSTGC